MNHEERDDEGSAPSGDVPRIGAGSAAWLREFRQRSIWAQALGGFVGGFLGELVRPTLGDVEVSQEADGRLRVRALGLSVILERAVCLQIARLVSDERARYHLGTSDADFASPSALTSALREAPGDDRPDVEPDAPPHHRLDRTRREPPTPDPPPGDRRDHRSGSSVAESGSIPRRMIPAGTPERDHAMPEEDSRRPHAPRVETYGGGRSKTWYRWTCPCGDSGDWTRDRGSVEAGRRRHARTRTPGPPPRGSRADRRRRTRRPKGRSRGSR